MIREFYMEYLCCSFEEENQDRRSIALFWALPILSEHHLQPHEPGHAVSQGTDVQIKVNLFITTHQTTNECFLLIIGNKWLVPKEED